MSLSRVNAVETLYAAFPALMYIDPTLGKPLLEPQFLSQLSPEYAVQYAVGDLGMPSGAKTSIWAKLHRIELSEYHQQQPVPQRRGRTFVNHFWHIITLNDI
jgi:hypothetical protein